MNIDKQTRNKYINFMTDGIKHVITTFDKRQPCGKGEKDAQLYFRDELSETMDTVSVEPFSCHPDSFMGWINITATCMIAGLAFYFVFPLATVILFAFGVFCMLSQLIFYKEWVDPLFKKQDSQNVYAVKKPSGEVKRRIILCGHADAAYEWHWHYKFGYKGFYGVLFGTVVGSFYLCGIAIAKLIGGEFAALPTADVFLWLGLADIPFIAFYIACYFYSDKKTVVDGANDNLTACFMSSVVPRFLADNNIQLQNTELCVLITGCEEAGLRGARAFCKAHVDEIKRDEKNGIETVAFCFETMRDEKNLACAKSEIMRFYPTDLETAQFYTDVAKEHGKKFKIVDLSVGTDNAAFGEYKIKSTCVEALDEIRIGRYYHTRLDTYDNLNPELLGDIMEITLDVVERIDKSGMAKKN